MCLQLFCSLSQYAFVLLIIIIVEIVAGILAFVYRNEVGSFVSLISDFVIKIIVWCIHFLDPRGY